MYCNSEHSNFDPLLTADQVAEILNCSKSQAYAMMRKHIFPIVSLGRMIRVKRSTLETFIEEMEVDSSTQSSKFVSFLQNTPEEENGSMS